MNPEQWRRIEELYHAASELDGEERSRLLAAADPEVRGPVERMLAQEKKPGIVDSPASLGSDEKGSVTGSIEWTDQILAPGAMIGPYQVESKLGMGGMGVVYCALDSRLGRRVAAKVAPGRFSARFERETQHIAALNHPHICTVYDVGPNYLVMELVEGETLSARLQRESRLSLDEVVVYGAQIASALAEAHAKGIVHRDLKPANIMLCKHGVKVLDFGIAKSPQDVSVTAAKGIVGTPAYMAPEQLEGKEVDPRTDLFALGLVLYEMATGQRLGPGRKLPSETQMPPGLSAVIERCLAAAPADRWPSATELEQALLAETLPRLRSKPEKSTARFPAFRKFSPWIIAAASIAGFAISVWLWRNRAPAPGTNAARQITFDPGIAAWPAISPDGKLLAFVSDRGEPGNPDIWLGQVAGGGFTRVVSQPGAQVNPQFSPDGTKVLYLGSDSNIYEVPALGGPARVTVENAGPFSVSNRGEIVFTRIPTGRRTGSIFIVRDNGGTPEPWGAPCKSSGRVAWSSDGQQLFFRGDCGKGLDGWMIGDRSGGAPKLLMASTDPGLLQHTGAWVGSPRHGVVFPGGQLLWSDLKSAPVSVTTGGSVPLWPAVGLGGELVFSAVQLVNRVQNVTLDQSGIPIGTPSETASAMGHFTVARNGKVMVYGRLIGTAAGELVVRNLESGDEKVFASHQLLGAAIGSIWPQASPDGMKVFYRLVGGQGGHYLLRVDSGEVKRVATLQEFNLGSDWSADGQRVIGECAGPSNGICEWDAGTGRIRQLASLPNEQLLYPSWSWDGRFVVFMRRQPGMPTGIWASPVRADGALAGASEWIELSDRGTENSRPRLSPDNSLLYYVTAHLGQRVLAVRKLDQTMRPLGDPLRPLHLPLETPPISNGFGPYPLIAVTRGKLYYSTVGMRGDLWALRLD